MPKSAKKSLPIPTSPLVLSRLMLFLGAALLCFTMGIYIGQQYFTVKQMKTKTAIKDKMLFVQDIEKGSMVPLEGKENTYDLSVKNENTYITYFSEEPVNLAGKMTIDQYLQIWESYFSKNHPNAALVMYDENGTQRITVGKLETAKKHGEKNRVDYTFRLLADDELKAMTFTKKPEQVMTEKFKSASLFIDAFPAGLMQQERETITNLTVPAVHFTPLDPANPPQTSVMHTILNLTGQTQVRYPSLFKSLAP